MMFVHACAQAFFQLRSMFTVMSAARQNANYELTHVDISLCFQIRYPRGNLPGSLTSTTVYSERF